MEEPPPSVRPVFFAEGKDTEDELKDIIKKNAQLIPPA
jgi:hypothetical protein